MAQVASGAADFDRAEGSRLSQSISSFGLRLNFIAVKGCSGGLALKHTVYRALQLLRYNILYKNSM